MAKKSQPASSLEELVTAKVAAGLPRETALEVAQAQIEHDAALAEKQPAKESD